ncbi:hypothetical protein MKC66_12515 [[Clostridium] innocuum]|nr:hypothetical protein [[Clostridium] innocuum]
MNYQADINVLSSPVLKIEKNVIEMDDAIIQINNIASVSLRFPPKYTYSPYAIGIFIISIMLFLGTVNNLGTTSIICLVSAAISGYMLYNVWEKNKNLGKNIIISTGSGGYFWINSKDDVFSLKVIDVIRNIMNEQIIGSDIVINLDKFNIMNNGVMVYTDKSQHSTSYSDISGSVIGNDNKIEVAKEDYPELKI